MKLFTIGFTQKTAEEFFISLRENNVQVLVDIRLNPDSQLAGFAKGENLPHLLKNLINCAYRYESQLTPSKEIFKRYRPDKDWET